MPDFYHYVEWSKTDSFSSFLRSLPSKNANMSKTLIMEKLYVNEHGHTFHRLWVGVRMAWCVRSLEPFHLGTGLSEEKHPTPLSQPADRWLQQVRAWPSWSLVFFFLSLSIKQKEVSLRNLIEAFEWSAEVAVGWMDSIKIGPKYEIIIERIPLETKAA